MKKAKVKSRRSFKRIRDLACFEVVVQMILSGYPMPTVADYIHGRGESTDIKQSSLVTILAEFRNSMPVCDVIAPYRPQEIIRLQDKFDDVEQDLKDITWAIDMLKENLKATYQMVVDTGYPAKNLQVDVDTLSRMIARRHDIKMDLGIGGKGRNLGMLTVAPAIMRRVHDKHGQVFDEIINNPEKLSQVVSGATRLLAASRPEEGQIIDSETVEE